MHIWNTKALAAELKSGELSQHERFKYLILFIVLLFVSIDLSLYLPEEPLYILDVVNTLYYIIATIVGLILSYRINKMGDNKEFIDRFICLSAPIYFKLIVIFFCIILLFLILSDSISYYTSDESLEESLWLDAILSMIFQLIYWWRIIHHIGWISRTDAIE